MSKNPKLLFVRPWEHQYIYLVASNAVQAAYRRLKEANSEMRILEHHKHIYQFRFITLQYHSDIIDYKKLSVSGEQSSRFWPRRLFGLLFYSNALKFYCK